MLNFIFSISEKDNIIGNRAQNDLAFHIKEDLEFFKKKTKGKTIIMGRNTFLSLPTGGLPDRKHVIVSRHINDKNAKLHLGVKYIENLEFVDELGLKRLIMNRLEEELFIIGGSMLYTHIYEDTDLNPLIKNIFVTEVLCDPEIEYPVTLDIYNKIKNKYDCCLLAYRTAYDKKSSKTVPIEIKHFTKK